MRKRITFASLISIAALAGCSGEPTKNDVKALNGFAESMQTCVSLREGYLARKKYNVDAMQHWNGLAKAHLDRLVGEAANIPYDMRSEYINSRALRFPQSLSERIKTIGPDDRSTYQNCKTGDLLKSLEMIVNSKRFDAKTTETLKECQSSLVAFDRDQELILSDDITEAAEVGFAQPERQEELKSCLGALNELGFHTTKAPPIKTPPAIASPNNSPPAARPASSKEKASDVDVKKWSTGCEVNMDGKPLFRGADCLVQEYGATTSIDSPSDGCVVTINDTNEGPTVKVWAYRNACADTDLDSGGVDLGLVTPSAALVNCWSNERIDACYDSGPPL